MIEVKINDNSDEAFEKGFKIFKKLCNKDGFMKEVRDRRYFKKPSEKRREHLKEVERQREIDKKKAQRRKKR